MRIFSILVTSGVLFTLASCATKQVEKKQLDRAGNRIMGLAIKSYNSSSTLTKDDFKALFEQALQKSFAPQIKFLDLDTSGPLETPSNIYEIGSEMIDDLMIVSASVTQTEKLQNFEDPESLIEEWFAESEVTVINGAKLRTVTRLQTSTHADTLQDFEEKFIANLQAQLRDNFQNPNIYPKHDPLHYGNLLFNFSQNLEKQTEEALNCSNASEILKYYDRARLFFARAKETQDALPIAGRQQEAHELNTRFEESTRKARIVEACRMDKQLSFAVDFDFGSLSENFIPFVQKAYQRSRLEEILKKYTDKPVKIRFSLEDTGRLLLQVDMRFDRNRYRAWTVNRIPETYKNFHVLSLDPYYALMQTLILFRASLPPETPRPLRASFSQMQMNLNFETLLSGTVSAGVAGRYIADERRVALGFPKSLMLTNPAFDRLNIFTRSEEIFQEKGWLSLSSCETLDGTVTEDGLLMRFFGLPCKL